MKRLIWVDSVKGALILLVVLGHCISHVIGIDNAVNNYLWCLIYSFHMPAFIAISGWVNFKKDNEKKYYGLIKRRFRQLIIPFFSWSCISYMMSGNIKNAFDFILYPTKTFWFLWALFFIISLFIFVDWFAEKFKVKQELLVCIMSLICFGILAKYNEIRILGIQYILYYFIFYSIGFYLNKYDKTIKSTKGIILLTVLWFIFANYWRPHSLPVFIKLDGSFATIFIHCHKFIVALLGTFAFLSIFEKFFSKKNLITAVLSDLGRISLGIYTCHMTFLLFFTSWINLWVHDIVLNILLCFFVLTISSFVIISLVSKWDFGAKIFLGKL